MSVKMREAASIIAGLMTRVDELEFSVESAARKAVVAPERTRVREERDEMDDLIDMFETSETIGAKKVKVLTPEKGVKSSAEGLEAKPGQVNGGGDQHTHLESDDSQGGFGGQNG